MEQETGVQDCQVRKEKETRGERTGDDGDGKEKGGKRQGMTYRVVYTWWNWGKSNSKSFISGRI